MIRHTITGYKSPLMSHNQKSNANHGEQNSFIDTLFERESASIKRQGAVYANEILAGYLTEWSDIRKAFYSFQYAPEYLKDGVPIGYRFPLQQKAFVDEQFPTFFQNLNCEGWCKAHQVQKSNLDSRDEFGLLLENGRYLIGAISVKKIETDYVNLFDKL